MRLLYLIMAPIIFSVAFGWFLLCKLDEQFNAYQIIAFSLWLLFFAFVYLCIFLRGTIKKNRYSFVLYIMMGLVLLGLTYSISFWHFPNLITTIGCSGVTIFYTFHFFSKIKKQFIDWVKWINIILTVLRFLLVALDFPEMMVLSWSAFVSGLTLAILFYIKEWNRKSINPKSEIPLSMENNKVFDFTNEIK